MDIWNWMWNLTRELRASGNDRVADLLYRIPHEVNEDRPLQVAALVPEALAAARSLRNPWMEVYVRHWNLQSRILKHGEGETALPEAAALLEFAHRDDTLSCPQSVCTTQDLAVCYGNLDGLGWARERADVCRETLARITPAWQCFDCISREYADALIDQDQREEAVAFLASQASAMQQAGRTLGVRYRAEQAKAVHLAGNSDEALKLLDRIDAESLREDNDSTRISRALLRAKILADVGRIEEAGAVLPEWGPAIIPAYYDRWTEVFAATASMRPERNTWELGRLFQGMVDHLASVGAHRWTVQIAVRQGRLALARGARWTARRALSSAEAARDRLRADAGAESLIAGLRDALGRETAPVVLPVPAEQLCDYLRDRPEADPEKDIDLLLAACAERPDDAALWNLAAHAMVVCNALAEARKHLWQYVKTNPQPDRMLLSRLMDILIDADDEAELLRLVETVKGSQPAFEPWARARLAFHRERWDEVGEQAARVLDLSPNSQGARRLWSAAAMAQDDFAVAVRLRREILDLTGDEPGEDDWDLITAASAMQDWESVRFAAARLGLELESTSGPVEESWGAIFIRYFEDGEWREYLARRTGPTTARIVSVASPGRTQHVNDWVVFDARPMEPPPEDEEERRRFIVPFRAVHTLEAAGFASWFVDGVDPGKEAFDAFRAAMSDRGWVVWDYSPDDYRVKDPENPDGDGLPGIYFFLAAPGDVPAGVLDSALLQATSSWTHPLAWLRLAEAAGGNGQRHREIIQRYGL